MSGHCRSSFQKNRLVSAQKSRWSRRGIIEGGTRGHVKEIGALIGGGGLLLKLVEKFSNGNPCFEVSLISSGKSFKRTRHVACQLEDSGFLAFASGIFLCEVFGSRIYSYSWILYTGFRVTFGLGAPSIGWEWSSGQMMEI